MLSWAVRTLLDSVYNTPLNFERIITQTGSDEDVKFYRFPPGLGAGEFNHLFPRTLRKMGFAVFPDRGKYVGRPGAVR